MPSPPATLIQSRMAQLGLNLPRPATRLGYLNLNKGSRRLQALIAGDLDCEPEVLLRLADVLQLAPEMMSEAVTAAQAS